MNQPKPLVSASGRVLPNHWLSVVAVIWAGQAVSVVTSFAASFAAVWYITETTKSPMMLALATVAAFLPTGLLSPFGGVIADKFNRKITMIVSDLAIGLVSLAIGLAIWTGHVSVGLVLVMAAARSVGQAFHGPAMLATMPMLVPEKHLMRINTLDQLVMSGANIGAPALGILLYNTIGFHSAMFLDFAGALVAVAGLMLAKIPTTHDEAMENQHVLANLKAGWLALSASRGLTMLVLGATGFMMLAAPIGAQFPLMTHNHFGGDGFHASLIEAVWSTGMVIGSVVLMVWGGGQRLARLMMVAAFSTGALCAVSGMLRPSMFVAFVVLCGVMGIAESGLNSPLMTLLQRGVGEEKLGRVMGLVMAVISLASPLGVVLGGALAEGIGVARFFAVAGIGSAALAVLVYSIKSVRALDRPATPA
ncbi:MAG: MFS transporter [Micrococcales bacterium]|nr:MFS transporter [Micrococcales bacterium]